LDGANDLVDRYRFQRAVSLPDPHARGRCLCVKPGKEFRGLGRRSGCHRCLSLVGKRSEDGCRRHQPFPSRLVICSAVCAERRQVFGLAGIDLRSPGASAGPVNLIATASQLERPSQCVLKVAFVPAYRCGAAPESHRVPYSFPHGNRQQDQYTVPCANLSTTNCGSRVPTRTERGQQESGRSTVSSNYNGLPSRS
jgi:hypothetical protein